MTLKRRKTPIGKYFFPKLVLIIILYIPTSSSTSYLNSSIFLSSHTIIFPLNFFITCSSHSSISIGFSLRKAVILQYMPFYFYAIFKCKNHFLLPIHNYLLNSTFPNFLIKPCNQPLPFFKLFYKNRNVFLLSTSL